MSDRSRQCVTVVARVPIDRVHSLRVRFGRRFLERCFSAAELAHCLRRQRPDAGLAARLAARVALRAALASAGVAVPVYPADAEVIGTDLGAPALRLRGRLAAVAPAARLSLAHDGNLAVAAVLLRARGQ